MPLESHGIFHPRINLSEHRVLWGRARSRRSRLELGTGGQDGGIGGVSPQLGRPPAPPIKASSHPASPHRAPWRAERACPSLSRLGLPSAVGSSSGLCGVRLGVLPLPRGPR